MKLTCIEVFLLYFITVINVTSLNCEFKGSRQFLFNISYILSSFKSIIQTCFII